MKKPSNKTKTAALAAAAMLALTASPLGAQTFPLSENSWSNPEFVNRFMGSYGVNTEIEPSVSREEAELLKAVPPLLQAGNTEAALTTLRDNMTEASSAAFYYYAASILLQQNKTDEAIVEYQTAIRKFPNYLRAYKNTGLAYLSKGQFVDALPYLQKAVELGDREGNTFGLLGYAYLNTGRYDLAADAYSIAQVTMPDNKDWAVGKASALLQSGNLHAAIPAFKALLARDPNRPAYYTSLANAYLQQGNQQEAAIYLELLQRRGLASAEPLMLLGDIYTNQSLPDLAVESYENALELGGKLSTDRLLRFVKALTQRGAYAQAEQFIIQLEQAETIELTPDQQITLLNTRSQIAMARGNTQEAIRILEDVVQRDPMNGQALLLLGEHSLGTQDFETAEFYFERATKVKVVSADALVQMARLKVAQKDYGEAVRLLERAQGIDPRSNVATYLDAVEEAYKATR